MRYLVTSVIPGIGEADCGELYCEARGDRESVTFRYSAEWLSHGYDLSPDVPVGPGTFYSSDGFSDLRAFSDAMPDRWGRNLLKRDEARRAKGEGLTPRTLLESDFLVGVADVSRQGSIRIWDESGNPLDATMDAVPRVVELPALLDAADRAAEDLDADVRDLVAAGSSLGGARPKATVIDADGSLCVCKLPKAGETEDADVCAWEHVVLELSRNAGIEVPKARLLRLGSRSALLTERFDRVGDERVPYISGMSAIEGSDGGAYSLDMLVDFVETYCEDPDRDCVELWRRALMTCLVGNTDNHMRNYGFLIGEGGWRLSPQFDVNPTPVTRGMRLASGLDRGEFSADPGLCLELREFFRVSDKEARRSCVAMLASLAQWRRVARTDGLTERSIDRMAGCFDPGIEWLEGLTGLSASAAVSMRR